MEHRATLRGLALVAAVFVMPGCARSLHQAPYGPARQVTDWSDIKNLSQFGSVYFGGQPSTAALDTAKTKNIQLVINLRSAREMKALDFDEAAYVRRLGMNYAHIPVTPDTLGPDDAIRLKRELEETSGPVLIHCASSNRVGALWAMYIQRHRGAGLNEAIELGRKAGMRSDRLEKLVRASAR